MRKAKLVIFNKRFIRYLDLYNYEAVAYESGAGASSGQGKELGRKNVLKWEKQGKSEPANHPYGFLSIFKPPHSMMEVKYRKSQCPLFWSWHGAGKGVREDEGGISAGAIVAILVIAAHADKMGQQMSKNVLQQYLPSIRIWPLLHFCLLNLMKNVSCTLT